MGRFCITAILLLFAAHGLAAESQRVTARQLVRTVDTALGDLVEAAGGKGGLDPKDPQASPFWSTLNGLRIRMVMIEGSLAQRDAEFFTLLDQGSTDLGALRVAWARTGIKNADASRNLRLASSSYRMLRANFGREGVRLRQGGGLNEAEQRQLQRLQRAQRRFAESLRVLRERAQRRNDPVTTAEIDRFRGEAERIGLAPAELEPYLNSLITTSEIRGEWEANAPYLKDDAPEDFVVANEMVEDLYVESDIGHVFTMDLGAADGGMDLLDQEVAVPAATEDGVEAIQVYESGGDDVVAEEAVPEIAPEPQEGEILEEDLAEGVEEPAGKEKPAAEALEVEDIEVQDVEVIEKKAEDGTQEEGVKKDPAPADPAQPPVPPATPPPNRPPIG